MTGLGRPGWLFLHGRVEHVWISPPGSAARRLWARVPLSAQQHSFNRRVSFKDGREQGPPGFPLASHRNTSYSILIGVDI